MKFKDILDVRKAALVLIASLSLACASTGGAKKQGYVGLVAAQEALNLLQDNILVLECNKTGAPAEPLCVPAATADKIHSKLAEGYKIHADAVGVIRNLPPALDTSTGVGQVAPFVTKIWALVDSIRGLFTEPKPLGAKLDELKSKK